MSMLDVEMNVETVIVLVLLPTLFTLKLWHVIIRVFFPSLRIDRWHNFLSLTVKILSNNNKEYLNICHFFRYFSHSITIVLISLHQYYVHHILFPKLFVVIFFRIVLLLDIFITVNTVIFNIFLLIEWLQFWQYWGL